VVERGRSSRIGASRRLGSRRGVGLEKGGGEGREGGRVRDRVLVVHKAEVGGGVVWWLGAAGQVVQVHRERLAWRRAGGRGGISLS